MGQAASSIVPAGCGGGEAHKCRAAGDEYTAVASGARWRSKYATEGRSEEEIRTAIEKSKEQGWSELKEQGCGHGEEDRVVWEQLKRTHPFTFNDAGERVELGRVIAEGGQAQIYEARLSFRDEYWLVAKVFKAEGFSLAELRRHWPRSTKTPLHPRGFREFELGAVAFDEIIRCCSKVYWGTFLKDGRFAFLMERCWGDLRALIDLRLKRRNSHGPPFRHRTTVRLMLTIAQGMKELHDRGILHRDLKAANILIGKEGFSARVADFESSMLVQGTGFWRAPEVLQELQKEASDRNVEIWTEKVDVYSYAMTCYEVLTGEIPFPHYFKSDWQKVIDGERPHLPKYVNPKLGQLVKRCWDKEPSNRPDFQEVRQILNPKYS